MGRSTLLQWNFWDIKQTEEIDLLILMFNLLVLVQETYFKNVNISLFRKYIFYNKIGSVIENKASGGVAIMVNKSIYLSDINLNTKLQAVAVRASIPKATTICSIYLLPNFHSETKHLKEVMAQLLPPFILMGDFNAHSNL